MKSDVCGALMRVKKLAERDFDCRENRLSLGRVKNRIGLLGDDGDGGTSMGLEFSGVAGKEVSSENGDWALGGAWEEFGCG